MGIGVDGNAQAFTFFGEVSQAGCGLNDDETYEFHGGYFKSWLLSSVSMCNFDVKLGKYSRLMLLIRKCQCFSVCGTCWSV